MPKLNAQLVIIILITVGLFIFTKNPLTGGLKLQLALLSILILIIDVIYLKSKAISLGSDSTFIYILTMTILSLVGATGWFFSPFFFSLYLIAFFLSFVFPSSVGIGFLMTLVVLFSFNIGEVDITYDFLTILSLLMVIPICLYLRKEYLKLRESQNEILILKTEHQKYQNMVTELLTNKITNFATNLRQQINDTKQFAFLLQRKHTASQKAKYIDGIKGSSQSALNDLKKFEEEVTGKELLQSPELT